MPEQVREISIANDFSRYPTGRYRDDGNDSGERFRDDILAPALKDESNARVKVVFDGVTGISASFLEETFGGLVRKCSMTPEFLYQRLEISTKEDILEDYVKLAQNYIDEAGKL